VLASLPIIADKQAWQAAADDALSVARARLAAGDHAGAREAVTKARKLFVATGIENKEVAELSEAIGRKEAEAAEQHKAQEEAARKKAGEMAAEAAANFKAEAELAEKTAKEEAAARKVRCPMNEPCAHCSSLTRGMRRQQKKRLMPK
jgi:hypothetical protein